MRSAKLISPDSTQVFTFIAVNSHQVDIRAASTIAADNSEERCYDRIPRETAINYFRALKAGGWKLQVWSEAS